MTNVTGSLSQKLVLHVEDSEDDAFFLERAIAKSSAALSLRRVEDGKTAVEYLSGSGAFQDRNQFPLPELVLLDINLPGLDGFDVLAWVRAQPALQRLPVWILSSSNLDVDIQRAKALGADRYLVKSTTFGDTVKAVTSTLCPESN
jgi:CheY-like chemotaxis protein